MTLQDALKSEKDFDDYYASITTPQMIAEITKHGAVTDAVRFEFAKAAMQAQLTSLPNGTRVSPSQVADNSVIFADALIQRLKQK